MRRLVHALVVVAALCYSTVIQAKTNKLFLNFDGNPSADYFGPLKAFDAHDLNPTWGAAETNQLRSGILAEVARDFREFDLDVTDVRPPGGGLIYTIGIEGTTFGGGETYGRSIFDYGVGRVHAATNSLYPEFQGANATIARFTTGLSGTVGHEAGHLFTLRHEDAPPNSAEAAGGRQVYHDLMATPELSQINRTQRATINRNYGANDYGKLAAYLGLCSQTLANWDFRNPNSTPANDFHIKFLSKHPSLTIQSEYSGDPFGTPTLARSPGLTSFHGMNYYEYELTWSGGAGVPPGGKFHTGISFMEMNDFVVRDTFLTRDGSKLPLKPRLPSLTGDAKLDGRFTIQMLNASDARMTLRDLRIQMLPKMVDLERMLPGLVDELMTADGELISPLADVRFSAPFELPPDSNTELTIDSLDDWLARMRDPLGALGGSHNGMSFDGSPLDLDEPAQYELGMFPSAYIFVTAQAVLPNQQVFDPQMGVFVTQDLVSDVFVQFAGVSRVVVPEPLSITLVALGVVFAARWRRAAPH